MRCAINDLDRYKTPEPKETSAPRAGLSYCNLPKRHSWSSGGMTTEHASLLTVKHRGLGSAEEWALFCILGVCRVLARPRDLNVALSHPRIAHPACYLLGLSFVVREGILDGLLEGHLPSSLARLLVGRVA